jgi:hypothetical protein
LIEAAGRRALQIEEHYLRQASRHSAFRVRSRLDEGLGRTDCSRLASELVGPHPGRSARPPAKKAGLDDGVSLS